MPTARDRVLGSEPWPAAAVVASNCVVFAVLLAAAALSAADSDLYYRSAQEDGLLEWMTFWAFVLAALVLTRAGVRQRAADQRFPWFLWGVAAFCTFVAMEEISWGQRLLGYRPPEYFLRENFQQELNIHNVFGTSLRKLLLKAVILGYGIVLPLLALPSSARLLLSRLGITSPPLALVPAFLATFVTYQIYPWSFSGEWVELMLGLGFLFAAIGHYGSIPVGQRPPSPIFRQLLVGFASTVLLGLATTALSLLRPADTPAMVAAARNELEALAGDFLIRGRAASRCGIHKRVFSFVEKYERDHLYQGEFSKLVTQGLPEDRARYFLDPWNSPIWIRHKCSDRTRKQRVFVYSFGPDRRRASSAWEILGDDIGVVFFERGF